MPIAWVQLAILFAALAGVPLVNGTDNDFWWHLKTGDYIVHNGIPRTDPFSWTRGGDAWVAHEWLSEVLIYGIQQSLGYAANVVLFALATSAALAIAYAAARRQGAGTQPLVALMLLAVVVMGTFVTVRPQVFTWLLFSVFLYILAASYDRQRAPVWALPPLMALWANLHLGFFYGLMLVGLWLAALCFDAVRGGERSLRAPVAIAAACVIAAGLNPSGPEILWYPLRYVFDSQVTNEMIAEWKRPDILFPFQTPIFVVAGMLALSLASRARPRPFLCLVTVAVIVLSMQAVRNAPFAAIVMLPVCGGTMARRWPWATAERDSGSRMNLATAASLTLLVGLVVPLMALSGGREIAFGEPSEDRFPSQGAEFVRQKYPGTRLFNDYNAGGYLVYKLYPDVPVFIDGRTDFYGNGLMREYFDAQFAEPGWEATLDKYDVEVVMVARRYPLAEALAGDSGWEKVFEGEAEVVYARR